MEIVIASRNKHKIGELAALLSQYIDGVTLLSLDDIGFEGDLCFETFRVLGAFPRELWPEALELISATGKYFVKRIRATSEA